MGHRSGFPIRGGAVRPNSGVMLAGATVRLVVILVAHSLVLLPCWAVGTQAVRTQPVPGEPQAPPGVEPPANLPDQGLEYIEMNGYPEGGEGEDGDSASYTSIVDTGEGGTRVDPRGSWLSFVQHSSRLSEGSNKKCEKKKKKKKERGELGNPRKLSEVVPTGLVGPQGPPGPPGPPGAQVSKEELLEEFRDLIKEAAERRAQIIIQEKCPTCSVENTTQMWLPTVHDDILMPHLPIAFHCKLRGGVDVPKKSLIEIANFQTPFSDGSFRRGDGMDVRSGRFTAPRSAIYQFSANLHIHHPVSSKRVEELRHRDNVRLLICINSLCQRHTSLEYISGLESNSRVFTVNLSGLLQLEAGQYASIYVDNSSVRRITVQAGSDFTGLLMGV